MGTALGVWLLGDGGPSQETVADVPSREGIRSHVPASTTSASFDTAVSWRMLADIHEWLLSDGGLTPQTLVDAPSSDDSHGHHPATTTSAFFDTRISWRMLAEIQDSLGTVPKTVQVVESLDEIFDNFTLDGGRERGTG